MIRNYYLLIFITLGTFLNTNAQIGIGNTDPKSTLDISTSDIDNPLNTDGILIPRVNTFPTVDPTLDQNGMMVFLTKDIPGYFKGFHFWDHPNSRWVQIGAEEWKDGINASGDNLIFASQAKTNGTDVVITDDGRIGFGTSDPVERFEFKGPGDNDFQITSANTNPPNFIFYNTGGTLDTPTALAANGEIGSIIVKTHDGNTIRENGGFRFYMDGVATPGSTPSKFIINTTPDGSISQQERISVRSNGNVGLSEPDPTARLDVNGTMRVRSLTKGAAYSDAQGNITIGPSTIAIGKVAANGSALKIKDATVSRLSKGNYRVVFNTARLNTHYVIQLAVRNCNSCGTDDSIAIFYDNQTLAGFDVIIGANDNNNSTTKTPSDLEFMFTVIDF